MSWKRNLNIIVVGQIFSLMSFGFGVPFIPYFIATMGDFSKDTIDYYTGLTTFLLSLGMMTMAPIWGILADKYGKKPMLQRSMLFGLITMAMMAFVQTPDQVMILRFAQGIFTGTVAAAACFVGSYTPKQYMSYSLGLLASANAVGFAIGPAIGGFVADKTDYRMSFLIGAAIMSIALFVITLFLKEPDKSEFAEEDENTKTQAEILIAEELPIPNAILHTAPLELSRPYDNDANTTVCTNEECEIHTHPHFWDKFHLKEHFSSVDYLFMLMLATVRFIMTLFIPYLPLYIKSISLNTAHISSKIGIINLFVGIATALAGVTIVKFADKKDKNLISRYLILTCILSVIVVYSSNDIFSFIISYLIFNYLIAGIEPILVSNSATNTSIKNKGTFFGFQTMLQNIGSMIAPVIATFLAINFGYKAILLSIPAFLVIVLIANEFIRKLIADMHKFEEYAHSSIK